MPRKTSESTIALVTKMLVAGHSYSKIRAELNVGPGTILSVRNKLLMAKVRFEPCGCGRRAGHKGMCSYRVAQLPYPMQYAGGRPRKKR